MNLGKLANGIRRRIKRPAKKLFSKEVNKMKGKWGIIVAVIIVIVAIIGFVVYGKTEQNLQAEEKRMRVAAKDYFNNYMSSNESTQVYEVTLDMLEEATKMAKTITYKA